MIGSSICGTRSWTGRTGMNGARSCVSNGHASSAPIGRCPSPSETAFVRLRDEMGEVTDCVSMKTAIELFWREEEERARKTGLPLGAAFAAPNPAPEPAGPEDQVAATSVATVMAVTGDGVTAMASVSRAANQTSASLGDPSTSTPAPASPAVGSSRLVAGRMLTPEDHEELRLMERLLLDWHISNLEFANASEASSSLWCSDESSGRPYGTHDAFSFPSRVCFQADKLSMRSWDQDDPFEFQGGHVFLPGDCLPLLASRYRPGARTLRLSWFRQVGTGAWWRPWPRALTSGTSPLSARFATRRRASWSRRRPSGWRPTWQW